MAAASAGHSIECLPHWFLGRPERLAGWLACFSPSTKCTSLAALPTCQHSPHLSHGSVARALARAGTSGPCHHLYISAAPGTMGRRKCQRAVQLEAADLLLLGCVAGASPSTSLSLTLLVS